MTRIAIHGCVSADQRKTILMLVDVVYGNLPTVRVVTKLTFRTILAAMQIRVTILTFLRSVVEDERLMAIRALHFCVAAAQWKLGL